MALTVQKLILNVERGQMSVEPPVGQQITHGNYEDMVTVSIRLADGGPLDDYVHSVWEINATRGHFVRDEIIRDVEAIPSAPLAVDSAPIPYSLEIQDKRFEWGASGAALDIILFLAATGGAGIFGGAAWNATKMLTKKLADSLKGQHSVEETAFSLKETEVVERAQWLIVHRFGENDSQLELDSVELQPNLATVTYRSVEWVYACDIEVIDGLVSFSRVYKRKLDH